MHDLFNSDSYLSIEVPSEGIYKDRGSRFLAFAYPVNNTDQIKSILEAIRKEHREARHHCFAYMLGQDRLTWRVNDDGEPSGTGGKPILGQINSAGLTNILIVVTRYFGGTLLGVSGLINAYRSAAADAIQNAHIIELSLNEYYKIEFPYLSLNDVMKILKDESIGHSEQSFDTQCRMKINFRLSAHDRITARFSRIDGLRMEHLGTR